MAALETVYCELMDASILLESTAGEVADAQAALFGVAPETLLFDSPGPRHEPQNGWDERAGDVWTAFRLESFER